MQFSLRTLFAAVAVVGIAVALWVARPSWQLGMVEIVCLAFVPASAIILAVNSTGNRKAWWIGITAQCLLAEFGFVHLAIQQANWYESIYMLKLLAAAISDRFRMLLLAWAFAPVVGLLCVFMHWVLVRPHEPKA